MTGVQSLEVLHHSEGWQRGKMKGWLSLCGDAELCYCQACPLGPPGWGHSSGSVTVLHSCQWRPFQGHILCLICTGGTENEWTIPGAVTVALSKFFFNFYRFSAICCLTSCSVQCKTYVHSGTQPLEEGTGTSCAPSAGQTQCQTPERRGIKARKRWKNKHMAPWTLVHPFPNPDCRDALAWRTVGVSLGTEKSTGGGPVLDVTPL